MHPINHIIRFKKTCCGGQTIPSRISHRNHEISFRRSSSEKYFHRSPNTPASSATKLNVTSPTIRWSTMEFGAYPVPVFLKFLRTVPWKSNDPSKTGLFRSRRCREGRPVFKRRSQITDHRSNAKQRSDPAGSLARFEAGRENSANGASCFPGGFTGNRVPVAHKSRVSACINQSEASLTEALLGIVRAARFHGIHRFVQVREEPENRYSEEPRSARFFEKERPATARYTSCARAEAPRFWARLPARSRRETFAAVTIPHSIRCVSQTGLFVSPLPPQ